MSDRILTWKLLGYDDLPYGSKIQLPEKGVTFLPMLERDIVKAGGDSFGDTAELIGDLVGQQVAETLRRSAGIDEEAELVKVDAWTDADFAAYRARYRAAIEAKS